MISLGVDIGGTAVKLGLIDRDGAVIRKAEAPVAHDGYKTPIIASVLAAIEAFLQAGPESPDGIGISATGQIDPRAGVVVGTCGSVPDWVGTRLVHEIGGRFALPAAAMNDTNCALIGEAWVGAARGKDHVVMVTLGTGVGGAVLSEGRILTGRSGLAGELGHMPLYASSGERCTCGNLGCIERYCSVTALIARAKAVVPDQALDGREIFRRAAAGDGAMRAVLDAWTGDIAAGLVGLVHAFNPELILIGGGVSAQEELLIDAVRRRVLDAAMPRFAEGLQIAAATLGNDAGIIGAVHHLRDQSSPKQS